MFYDVVNRQIKEKQEYGLYNYQKYLPVLFNCIYSTTAQQTKKLQYPHSLYDCATKLAKNASIESHFLSDMSAIVRVSNNSKLSVTLDLLPHLTEIIKPNLRAVSYLDSYLDY